MSHQRQLMWQKLMDYVSVSQPATRIAKLAARESDRRRRFSLIVTKKYQPDHPAVDRALRELAGDNRVAGETDPG